MRVRRAWSSIDGQALTAAGTASGIAVSATVSALVAARGLPAINTDLSWQLVWGSELVDGRLPSYPVPEGPTLHPLTVAAAAVLTPFGPAVAADVMALGAVVGFAGLLAVAFLLGRQVESMAAGVVAAAVLLFSPISTMAANSVWDIPFAALLVLAGLLETRRRRRGAPVLALLTLAGLIRPEAWLFTAVYAVYLGRPASQRDRLLIALSVAIAPAVWSMVDLLVTGDPLTSLTYTQDAAAAKGLPTGLDDAPRAAQDHLRNLVGAPVVIGGSAGLVLLLRRPRARPLLAMVVLGLVAFMAVGLAGLALRNARYLLVPAVVLSVGFGVLVAQAGERARQSAHRPLWALLLVLLVLGLAATLGDQLRQVRREGVSLEANRDATDDLRRLAATPAMRDIVSRCPRVFLPDAIAQSIVIHTLDLEVEDVVSAQLREPSRGVFLDGSERLRRTGGVAYFPPRAVVGSVPVPPEFQARVSTLTWEVRTHGC